MIDRCKLSGHSKNGRLGTGSCVSVLQTTNLVVYGLGRAFLCLSVCLSVCHDLAPHALIEAGARKDV